jgi:multidrug efflux pump subunit AcrA (membrane-fusion protein)
MWFPPTPAGAAQADALQQAISGLQSKLGSSQMLSPINGIVMKNDLKKKEFALAGAPLVVVASTSIGLSRPMTFQNMVS